MSYIFATRMIVAVGAVLALASGVASAQNHEHMNHTSATAAPAGDVAMSQGEVKKIDKAAGKLTIQHGPLTNLGMPAMTMVFRVKETTMLDQVKVGDKINFHAENLDGALTVTQLEVAH